MKNRYQLSEDEYIEVESKTPVKVTYFGLTENVRKQLTTTNINPNNLIDTEDEDEVSITVEEAIAKLDDKYDLVFVNHDDKLSDDQVDALVSGDLESFWEKTAEFESESRDVGIDSVIDNEFDDEEWDSLSAEDQQTVRDTIAERDNSDWVTQLINQTPNPLLRIKVVDEDDGWSYEEVVPQQVLDAIQLQATEHNVKVIQAALNESSPEYSTLLGYWIVSLDLKMLYQADQSKKLRITNPYLYLGNPLMGSGWVTEEALEGTVVVERSDVHTDKKAFGYSISEVYGGLQASQFEAEVQIIDEIDETE